jgi:hypothetical protein
MIGKNPFVVILVVYFSKNGKNKILLENSSTNQMTSQRDESRTMLNEKYQSWVNNNRFSDITFLIGKELTPMYAHKFMLYSSCPYFEQTFKEKGITELIFPDLSPITFYEFLYFIYCGSTSDSMEFGSAIELLELSHQFEMKLLKKFCLSFIEEHSDEVLKSENFLNLKLETLITLLESNHFKIENEFEIFNKCLEWSRKNEKDILPLLSYIRFTIIDITLLEKIEMMNLLPDELMLNIYKRIYFKQLEYPRNSILVPFQLSNN